jgi:hypothetical protein
MHLISDTVATIFFTAVLVSVLRGVGLAVGGWPRRG